jgi:malate:Na+ symporter
MGLETIAVILIPSYLVHANWFGPDTVDRTKKLLQATDAVDWFITVLIVGSIVGIERRVLIAGLARIVLPLAIGSVAAAAAGTLVGAVSGLKPFDAFFLVVVPVLGGGVTAGALPLSVGYASILGNAQGDMLALMLPSVILGNFTAMVCAGLLDCYDRPPSKNLTPFPPHLKRLVNDANRAAPATVVVDKPAADFSALAAAVMVVIALYGAGWLAVRLLKVPAPLAVLIVAAFLQLTDTLSPRLRSGVLTLYRFFVVTFTYPLLFVVGLVLTPWPKFVEGLAPAHLAVIFAAVSALSVSGFLASRWIGLHPVDGAMVTLTRAAMGGTGDVAILNAGRRIDLMSFAQISTRIGGAATVALALIAVKHFAG